MKTQLTAFVSAWLLLSAIVLGHEPLGHRGATYEATSPLIPEGKCLRLDIVDQATGRPTAARFSLAINGEPYTPETLGPGGIRFLSIHTSKKQRFVALYGRGTGPVEVPLNEDARRVTIRVAKGFEYLPEDASFDVSKHATHARVELTRWSDIQKDGWRPAEEHLHYERLDPKHNEDWLAMLAADDLSVGHFMMLVGGNLPGVWADQYGYGPTGIASGSGGLLVPGEEYRDTLQGHINLLGLGEIIPPIQAGGRNHPYNYPLLHDVLRQARRSGGIVGPAHGAAYGGSATGIIDTVLGAVDFLEIANTHLCYTDVWYRLMNCGYLVPPVAGTDLPNYPFRDPWQPMLGEVRTYVRNGGTNDFDSWKQAVRSGETFVTSGPIIRLDADGVGPGQTLHLPPGGAEVTIRVQLASPRPPESLELIRDGEPVPMEIEKRLDSRVHRWLARGRLRIDESCWLAARGQGVAKLALERGTGIRQSTMAHTAAVRVLVGEAPIRSHDDAEFLIDGLKRQFDFYSMKGRYREPEHKDRMLQLIREAIAKLEPQQME